MGSDGAKQWRKPPPPPRTLDVRKYADSRASDLQSLLSVLSNRLNHDFRSRRNKRRRTTSFDSNGRRGRFRKSQKLDDGRENDPEKNKLPRRVRRRIELKQNPDTGFSVSGDGTRRLRTHVWHAKRFTLAKLWGFYLPLGLHGRGRGSRALLKWYRQGVVVHDASYYGAVQLEGPEDSLLSILSTLLTPSPIDLAEDVSKFISSGKRYGSAMLHYARDDGSKAICPVTYLWRPSCHQDSSVGLEDKEADENIGAEVGAHLRRVWIWMHPSAFVEGLNCLKLACQKKMDETGVLVDCVSLDGQLGKLEVMGSRAFQLLQKILRSCNTNGPNVCPAGAGNLESSSMKKDKNGCGSEQNFLEESLSSGTVASVAVIDPRTLVVKRSLAVQKVDLVSSQCDLSDDKKKDHSAGDLHVKEEAISIMQSKYEPGSSLSKCKDLWDAIEGVHPPISENLLCLERHKKSLDFFCLKDSTLVKSTSTQAQRSTLCPILLLRNTGLLTGWSVILPISWVKAFWIPLVSGGAHAIGLREKHWIACDVGLPSFPYDFPDCNAYSCIMAKEAAEEEKRMELRTPDLRPLKVPIPPPWTKISFGFDKVAHRVNGIDISSNIGSHEDHTADLDCEISDVLCANNTSSSCELFVARTSRMLTSFLKEISGDSVLLFPKGPDRKSFSHIMKDKARLNEASKLATLTNNGRRLCYLRVLLHAYKEGVFDNGAVVCAPHFCDLSMWTSSSENNEVRLQVPHALLGSYFKQLSNGEWEFQLPEDPLAREAYRQPIGFVATGFVQGSKRPLAIALCEAILLARLRQEQWSEMPAKRRKEIFVLVRNMRSTAYRLALASIILEEQEEDVMSL